MKKPQKPVDPQQIYEAVRSGYAKVATGQSGSCCGPNSSCCGSASAVDSDKLAKGIGYTDADLAALPEGANMGLSCGNPSAIAALKPSEVVLDLGSGGGFDVFVVARKVGPTGRAIGVDMTPEMLAKARRNAVSFAERTGLHNCEFRLGEIEHLPVADNSIDVIISNCVVNLSPDKPQVWREMFRVLKPGGRVAVSDLALRRPLPDALRESVAALVGCVAGAVLIDETRRMAGEAGFEQITIDDKSAYLETMTSANDPLYADILRLLPPDTRIDDFVASISISARKPVGIV